MCISCASDFKRHSSEPIWDSLFGFAVVREPWARFALASPSCVTQGGYDAPQTGGIDQMVSMEEIAQPKTADFRTARAARCGTD
jgi:hypothetical protein